MSTPLRVLIIEDSKFDAQLLLAALTEGGYEPVSQRVETEADLRQALRDHKWDVILADFNLPQFSAPAALEILQESGLDIPLIIVSGGIGETTAVAAMKAGASDYLMKGNLTRLAAVVERELRDAAVRVARRQAESELRENEEQFRVAREIQQRLFPTSAPDLPGFEIAGATYPAAAAGGDYFDYLTLPHGCLGLVIADVTGHGIGPALLMAETRAYLRLLSQNHAEISEILTRANRALEDDVDIERFVTLLLAKLDPQTRILTYGNAGHPNGCILDQVGAVKTLLKRTGPPLGITPNTIYHESQPIQLIAGDMVLMVTDGVEEATSYQNEFFGNERVLDVVRAHATDSARDILRALYQAVRAFSQQLAQTDDITLLLAKVK